MSLKNKKAIDKLQMKLMKETRFNACLKTYFNLFKGGYQMLRIIKKAVDYIHTDDPCSAIKVHTIRTWCKEGKIKFLTVGNKILIDMDSLLEYIGQKRD